MSADGRMRAESPSCHQLAGGPATRNQIEQGKRDIDVRKPAEYRAESGQRRRWSHESNGSRGGSGGILARPRQRDEPGHPKPAVAESYGTPNHQPRRMLSRTLVEFRIRTTALPLRPPIEEESDGPGIPVSSAYTAAETSQLVDLGFDRRGRSIADWLAVIAMYSPAR